MKTTLLALTAAATVAGGLLSALPAQAAPAALPSLALVSDRDGDSEIYRRAANGTLTQLTRNRSTDHTPVWSPDGRRIAFVSDRDGDDELFVMNADGSGVRQLTRNAAADLAPSWSPDGRRIAFASNRTGGEPEIWVMASDGTKPVRITRTASYVVDHTPAWSPDGGLIAFASNRVADDNVELYAVKPDGSGLRRLTRTAAGSDENAPTWSPDGRRIAFSSNRGRQHDLYVMNRDGSGVRKIAGDPALDDVFPRWTRNGAALVYWTFPRPGGATADVWAVDADGTDRRKVLATRAGESQPDPQPPLR